MLEGKFNTKLFAQKCEFKIGATKAEHLPNSPFPEFAFIGRSNVGKSSLLNALLNRRNLARASQAPGRTRQINFFLLAEKIFLVDLPGYGYARAPKHEIRGWNALMKAYLHDRSQLQRLFLLVDARHGLKPSDIEMIEFLSSCAVIVQVVLTKVDKINRLERLSVVAATEEKIAGYSICHEKVISCSSATKEGIEEAQLSILESAGLLI